MAVHHARARLASALLSAALLATLAAPPGVLSVAMAGTDHLDVFEHDAPAVDLRADRAVVCADAPAGAFSDVAATATHAANIDCLAAYGITVGVGGGNYDPSGVVPRGQMASFLVNFLDVALDTTHAASGDAGFTDIDGHTHAANIGIAHHLGVAKGRTATVFDPNTAVSRAQMATFVAQALGAAGADPAAGDGASGSDGAFDDLGASATHAANIEALAAAGIVSGIGDRRFDPTGEVSRAQMATFLVNAAAYLYAADVWAAPPLTTDLPRAVLAGRPDATAALDRVEVVFDRDVVVIGEPFAFAVHDTTNDTLVGTGIELSVDRQPAADADPADRLELHLDADLVAGEVYWLHLDAAVVLDPADDRGLVNHAQQLAFTYTVAGDDGALPPSGPAADITFSDVEVAGTAVAHGGSTLLNEDDVPAAQLTGVATLDDGGSGGGGGSGGSGGGAADPTIDDVALRIGGGAWTSLVADDGAFDSVAEAFTGGLGSLADGVHLLELRATDSDGGESPYYAFTVQVVAGEPAFVSAVTEPSADRIVVTFSEPVVCPETDAARAAWDFVNRSVIESGTAQADGAPSAVTQPGEGPSETCYLEYTEPGEEMETGDFGGLWYDAPGGADGVRTDDGTWTLDDLRDEDVENGVVPTFDGVGAVVTGPEDVVTLEFNQPILCVSIGESDLEIKVNGQTVTGTIDQDSCTDPASSTAFVWLNTGSFVPDDDVEVTVVGLLYDESEGNTVQIGSSQQTVAVG